MTVLTNGPATPLRRIQRLASRMSADARSVHDPTAPADVLIVGGVYTLLVPVLDVLDGCGWTVRYQTSESAALEWLNANRTCVALVEVDETWQDTVARLRRQGNCARIIIAAEQNLRMDEVLRAGTHDALRLPFERYDLLWSVVTAWHEVRSERGSF